MKKVEWNEEKNKSLIEIRGVSFEEVVEEMVQNRIIRIFQHQNQIRYPNQHSNSKSRSLSDFYF